MDDEAEEIFAEDNGNGYSGSVTDLQTSLLEQVGQFLIHNGWYLLFGLIGFYVIWEKILRREWEKWKQNYNDRQASARYHKDPDAALSRLQAMEESRRKMQDEYNRASALHVEKLREREEIRRQEKIKEWEKQSKGSSSNSKNKPEIPDVVPQSNRTLTTSRFRNTDYNPLTGTGGGSYRPTRRGGGSGGG